jgi:hypothetical protein
MHKYVALMLIICLVASGLSVLAVPPVTAQAGYKPSAPQISSIKSVDSSYDVPPSSTTDPYTGVTTTYPGYRVNQMSIEVTIKNQPFTPYIDESEKHPVYGQNGKEFNLYYQVEVKGRFGENWRTFDNAYNVVQSNSGYTVVSGVADYVAGSQLDFRAKAMIGYKYNTVYDSAFVPGPVWGVGITEQSDWSKVQTFTIPGFVPSQTETISPSTTSDDDSGSSQSPEHVIFSHPFFLLGVGALLGGVIVAVIMTILRWQSKTSTTGV